MFNVSDTVMYGTQGVCLITDIIERTFQKELMKYYVLKPVYQKGATIFVPVDNEKLTSKMKKVLSLAEIHQLIHDLPQGQLIWIDNDNLRREKYKEILKSGNRQDIIYVIQTLYLKQEELKEKGKKLQGTDVAIFNDAETMIYEEFAYVLNISREEVVPYIINTIQKVG